MSAKPGGRRGIQPRTEEAADARRLLRCCPIDWVALSAGSAWGQCRTRKNPATPAAVVTATKVTSGTGGPPCPYRSTEVSRPCSMGNTLAMEGTLFETEPGRLPHASPAVRWTHRPPVAGAAVAAFGYFVMTAVLVSIGLIPTKPFLEGSGRTMGRRGRPVVLPGSNADVEHADRVGIVARRHAHGDRRGGRRRGRPCDRATLGAHRLVTALVLEVTSFGTTTFVIDRERPTVPHLEPGPPTSSFLSGHAWRRRSCCTPGSRSSRRRWSATGPSGAVVWIVAAGAFRRPALAPVRRDAPSDRHDRQRGRAMGCPGVRAPRDQDRRRVHEANETVWETRAAAHRRPRAATLPAFGWPRDVRRRDRLHAGKRLGGGPGRSWRALSRHEHRRPLPREVLKSKHVPAQVENPADQGSTRCSCGAATGPFRKRSTRSRSA